MEQISKKSILLVKNTQKMNITIDINIHIQISLCTNFQLKLTTFWTKFAKKGSYRQSKTDKIDTTIEFCIFELVFVSNFRTNNFEFLDQIYPIKVFIVKTRKSEHHHRIPVYSY